MCRGTIRLFDHTADMGMEVTAPTLEALFETAAGGMFGILCDIERVRPRTEVRLIVSGADREEMLIGWLSDLLSRHDADGILFSSFSVVFDGPSKMTGTARGEIFDASRHEIHTELKAVTYHQVRVEGGPDGFRTKIVLDV